MGAKAQAQFKRVGIIALATGGFVGYCPVASGTAGSLVGLAIVWLMRETPLAVQIGASLLLCGVGIWASDRAGRIFREADSSKIVIDEIVGLMITMLGLPTTGYWLAFGFVIFRILDVVKIPPANYFDQRVKNGWGVMMDDVSAGVYGNLLLHLMLRAKI